MAESTCHKDDHRSIGVSPFKENCGLNPTYGKVPLDKQCITMVETKLKTIEEVQSKLTECLQDLQEGMNEKHQFPVAQQKYCLAEN